MKRRDPPLDGFDALNASPGRPRFVRSFAGLVAEVKRLLDAARAQREQSTPRKR
jgi:hypothetical protein